MIKGFRFLTPITDRPHLPLLFFLPGMDGTGKLFYRQVSGLQRFFNLRCLSIPRNDRSDWITLTKTVITLIETEREKLHYPDVYLCGESFGACLALSVAVTIPNLFKKLILVNCASSFPKCPWLSWGIPLTTSLPDFIYPYSNLAFLPWLACLERITDSDRQALLAAIQSIPPDIIGWRLSLLRDFSLLPQQLTNYTRSVLLIAAARDRLLPSVQESLYLKNKLPNAKLLILPDSGHACLLEQPVNLAQLVNSK
jgi:pimeloyl-ACP methyl ester carboxylesterase